MIMCQYCVAHKSCIGILVDFRTVVIVSVLYGTVLWPCGTPAGRDIAVILWV